MLHVTVIPHRYRNKIIELVKKKAVNLHICVPGTMKYLGFFHEKSPLSSNYHNRWQLILSIDSLINSLVLIIITETMIIFIIEQSADYFYD